MCNNFISKEAVAMSHKESEIRVVYAWCGKVLREATPWVEYPLISHGICQDCRKKVLKEGM